MVSRSVSPSVARWSHKVVVPLKVRDSHGPVTAHRASNSIKLVKSYKDDQSRFVASDSKVSQENLSVFRRILPSPQHGRLKASKEYGMR